MIEGLKVKVAGTELADLCLDREKHHRERVAAYAEQLANFQRAKVEGMNYSNGDPSRQLEEKRSQHEFQADEMAFLAKHIDVLETYVLSEADLVKLGICKRGAGW